MSPLKAFLAFVKKFKKRPDHALKKASPTKPAMSRYLSRSTYDHLDNSPGRLNWDTSTFLHEDLRAIREVIRNRFYFATLAAGVSSPKNEPNVHFLDTDKTLVYNNFYNDFGPLNIACLHKYCHGVNGILKDPKYKHDKIVHYTSSDAEKHANAVFLVACYALLYLNKSPFEVYGLFVPKGSRGPKRFRDVSIGVSQYTIDLMDCLNAVSKASSLGFFNLEDFDVREYEKYEQIKNGDLNWIVPRKFLAFLGPSTEPGSTCHHPEKYLNYFMKNEVAAVIRLNSKTYDSFRFTNAGILHYDLFFPDGMVPPSKVLRQFFQIAENTRGAIAVHCKAGLGRTGTLIAAYVMKHYRMTATEAIAWLRICRPGSVIGHQQAWLQDMENNLWREGHRYRRKYHGDESLILHHKRGIYSMAAKFDRKVRFKEYLSKENLESVKPMESSEKSNFPEQRSKGEAEKKSREPTQGDKLNEIKMSRAKALVDPKAQSIVRSVYP